MKVKLSSFVAILFIIVLLCGCRRSNDVSSPPTGEIDVLINSSFEMNGRPSLEGWYSSGAPLVSFSSDVPSNGGNYSVKLESSNPGGFVSTKVPMSAGVSRYRFSVWAKYESIHGRAYLNLQRPDTTITRKSISTLDSVWTYYTIEDTLAGSVGDSLVVVLVAGFSPLPVGRTYFDLCKLERLR